MAKFFPCLLLPLLLAQSPLARGAGEIIEQFKKNRRTEENKAVIDAASREEVNAVDGEGRSALFYSRDMGTALLLFAGADPNLRDKEGRTPLFRAVSRSGDEASPIMLDLLLLKHMDPNAHDNAGFTPLAWAAHEGNLPAVRMLLLAGANPAPGDVPGNQTPLYFALQQGDDKMADVLRHAADGTASKAEGRGPDAAPDQRFEAAAAAARLSVISEALADGADINARDKDGATALFRAVADRRASVAALLLLKGANPSLGRNSGYSPLMQCATSCNEDSVRMLMDLLVAGANVNAVSKDGTTALSQAVHSGDNVAALWTIWRGASLDVHSPDGTLMQSAASHPETPSMVALLKGAGLKEEASTLAKEKSFILINAVKTGTLEDVEAELKKGTPVDAANKSDQTALEWAVCYERFDVADLLLKHGANINHQHYYNGESLIHTIAQTKGEDTSDAAMRMQKMIDRGANPNLLMKNGCTPLMVAAREGNMGPSLELLLAVTTNLNARDKDGLTALGLARQRGHAGIAKMLEAKGATE